MTEPLRQAVGGPAARRGGARPRPSWRRGSGRARRTAASRTAARPTSPCSSAMPARSSSSVLLTRNAAAAAPIRVCRENLDAGAVRGDRRQLRERERRNGRAGATRTRSRCSRATADALGLDEREVVVAETGVIGVPLEIDLVTDGVRKAAGSLARDRATGFTRAIMTTDRAPKNLSVKAGGVTISAQAKGAGMIQPGFATMLCFVQTDAQISRSRRGPPPGRRRLVRADHRRRADVHQRHRRPPGDRRDRDARCPRGSSTRSSWRWRSRSSPTARAPSGSAAPR